MNSWFLVLLLHLSLLVQQLLALNPEEGNVSVTVKCIERERQALLSLKRGFELENDWIPSWGDGETQKECCSWEGVQCSNETGHVLMLDLHAGADDDVTVSSISPSLGELRYLNYLDLSYIQINRTHTEAISDFIGSLTLLRHLNLSHCGFRGNIPSEVGNLIFLEYLDLHFNDLEGQIPPQFSNLSRLGYLNLNRNSLYGEFSPQVTNMSLLRHIDLFGNDFTGPVPPSLGNLSSLEYLDLSYNHFTGTIPLHFGNLSNLQFLDLSSSDDTLYLSSDLQWVSHLSSLKHLSLNRVNLSSAKNWQGIVSGLPHLQHLDFGYCNLLDSIPSSISPAAAAAAAAANFSTSLSFVDISNNHLMNSSLIFPWLMNSTDSLSILRMNDNRLKGTIPEAFKNLSSLEELNLANNILNGQILISLFHSCNLRELDLFNNWFTGQFHEFVRALSRCAHIPPLETLDLGWNEITGMVPDLSQLSYLQKLLLDHNGLNGTIHEGIGELSDLVKLSLGNNKLEGLISEAHFLKLSNLSTLDLSRNNALVFNVSNEWVPPFNLIDINLASCNLGPGFPRWLQTQQRIFQLDISQAEINDTVPDWFWEQLPRKMLNISQNYVRGKIENNITVVKPFPEFPLQELRIIDLSSNLFEGAIPAFLSTSAELFLSNNKFSAANLFLCANSSKNIIRFLDLSNNSLRGDLPDCWIHFESLIVLDLSDNYFDGNIPTSMGSLRNIQSLHLGGNIFSGEIPLSLMNCTKLQVFVAAQNHLSGLLPSWIGEKLPGLLVLSLYSNKFHGSMPLSICNLKELHVLDLSLNDLSGNIPKCISNLSTMATTQANSNPTIGHDYDYRYDNVPIVYSSPDHREFRVYHDSASLTWKGKMSKYRSTLGLLRIIDLSGNRIIGEIPSEMMSLVGLVSLNISRNMLSGEIPQTIGQLRSLDSLDLSRNRLSGRIPPQLAQVDRLSVLDLSYNDLSGEIPRGTQLQARNASDYMGNPKLCGAPLNTCPIPVHKVDENDDDHVADERFLTKGFYIAMAIGFVTGFWGVCFSLIFKKSWRYAYFKFWSDVYDKLYVLIAIKMAKLQRI